MTDYPTIEDCVGETPLVRLQRLPGETSNTILVKLEGNNPAGSVKDRPAISMIQRAEERGVIQSGDTLIEATSGNTGIALAMAAAIKGYRMVLIMPSHMSDERKSAMAAYGAELVMVTQKEGMEGARDLAEKMQLEGKGHVLDQFANEDRSLRRNRARNLSPDKRRDHAFRQFHGYNRDHYGMFKILQGGEPGYPDCWIAACRGFTNTGDSSMAESLPAKNLQQ
jgi:hypothetical protein